MPLAARGLLSLETEISKGETVALFTLKGEAVAVAVAETASRKMLATKTGIVAQTKRVKMKPGTYTKAWKMAEGGCFSGGEGCQALTVLKLV